jgi:plastocyanin
MNRRTWAALAIACVIAVAASCGDDNNAVTGPAPNATATPEHLRSTYSRSTCTPGGTTPTPPPAGQTATVNVGEGGGNSFVDQTSGNSTTTIRAGDTVRWVWVTGLHSTTSGSCPGGACAPDGVWDSPTGTGLTFSRTFAQAGSFPYYCRAHGAMMQGTVVVQ